MEQTRTHVGMYVYLRSPIHTMKRKGTGGIEHVALIVEYDSWFCSNYFSHNKPLKILISVYGGSDTYNGVDYE